jgi:hypothetical protein
MEGLITFHQIDYKDREKQIQQRGISSLLNSGRLHLKVISQNSLLNCWECAKEY